MEIIRIFTSLGIINFKEDNKKSVITWLGT